jgi:hypothetical protein
MTQLTARYKAHEVSDYNCTAATWLVLQMLAQAHTDVLSLKQQLRNTQLALADSQHDLAATAGKADSLRMQLTRMELLQQQQQEEQQQRQQQQAENMASTPATCKAQVWLVSWAACAPLQYCGRRHTTLELSGRAVLESGLHEETAVIPSAERVVLRGATSLLIGRPAIWALHIHMLLGAAGATRYSNFCAPNLCFSADATASRAGCGHSSRHKPAAGPAHTPSGTRPTSDAARRSTARSAVTSAAGRAPAGTRPDTHPQPAAVPIHHTPHS